MAVSESYLSFVLEQLEGVRRVVTKRMFGGVGLYSDSVFFGVIDNDTLFFKTDDILAERYRRLGMPPFAPIPGAKPMAYHQVPPQVLEDSAELTQWAADSIRVATASSTVRKRPRPTARRPLRRGDGAS